MTQLEQLEQTNDTKAYLSDYLQSLLGHEVGSIRLMLSQECSWYSCGVVNNRRLLEVELYIECTKEYEYEDRIGSLVVKKCERIDGEPMYATILTSSNKPLYEVKFLCLFGKETDNLFKYALGA